MGHVRMMAAVQPYLSGAISKTVNLPETATVDEIADVYLQGWKLGLKALAVYRDNCKVGQPLSTGKKAEEPKPAAAPTVAAPEVRVEYRPRRLRLPKARFGRTTSFAVGGAEGYITANAYDDGRLGEVFLKLGKQGSTLAGVMDAFSIAISIALQYGVPLETYVQKFTNLKFEPAGMTDDADVRMAQSIMDYIFRRLALDYLSYEERAELGIYTAGERARYVSTGSYLTEEDEAQLLESETLKNDDADNLRIDSAGDFQPPLVEARTTAELFEATTGRAVDAPLCLTCGTKMRPAGSCYVCEGCGTTQPWSGPGAAPEGASGRPSASTATSTARRRNQGTNFATPITRIASAARPPAAGRLKLCPVQTRRTRIRTSAQARKNTTNGATMASRVSWIDSASGSAVVTVTESYWTKASPLVARSGIVPDSTLDAGAT